MDSAFGWVIAGELHHLSSQEISGLLIFQLQVSALFAVESWKWPTPHPGLSKEWLLKQPSRELYLAVGVKNLDGSCAWRVIQALNTAVFGLHTTSESKYDNKLSYSTVGSRFWLSLTRAASALAAHLKRTPILRGGSFWSGGCRGKSMCAWLKQRRICIRYLQCLLLIHVPPHHNDTEMLLVKGPTYIGGLFDDVLWMTVRLIIYHVRIAGPEKITFNSLNDCHLREMLHIYSADITVSRV